MCVLAGKAVISVAKVAAVMVPCSAAAAPLWPLDRAEIQRCLYVWLGPDIYIDIYSYKHQYCQASAESGIDKQQNAHFDLNSTDLILYIDFYLCGKTNLQECT